MAGKNDSKLAKKLPSRASRDHPKHTRRSILAIAQEARKASRREAQEAAAQRNRIARSRGELTPWEKAKAKRLTRSTD